MAGGFFREKGLYISYTRRTILDEYTTVEHRQSNYVKPEIQ
jgi:hypothetical protein